jgi:hypothetical protein
MTLIEQAQAVAARLASLKGLDNTIAAHTIETLLQELCNKAALPAAQRPWVDLMPSTILDLMPSSIPAEHDGALMEFARAIEDKLKERNT